MLGWKVRGGIAVSSSPHLTFYTSALYVSIGMCYYSTMVTRHNKYFHHIHVMAPDNCLDPSPQQPSGNQGRVTRGKDHLRLQNVRPAAEVCCEVRMIGAKNLLLNPDSPQEQ